MEVQEWWRIHWEPLGTVRMMVLGRELLRGESMASFCGVPESVLGVFADILLSFLTCFDWILELARAGRPEDLARTCFRFLRSASLLVFLLSDDQASAQLRLGHIYDMSSAPVTDPAGASKPSFDVEKGESGGNVTVLREHDASSSNGGLQR